MTYESTTIDRRAAYYARLTADPEFDSLSFYVRAEKGRELLAQKPVREIQDEWEGTP